ncbi:ejaculatory bulb-specific protein 3-like [Chrysoperla carnea]|uniref:ejaculatory bulb-specific protein 3-like n=1 Tax=Chrysoperla carnea TaxID=189513 RepID=UPI001D06B1CD|nr:ejaculatory bulb-specific protein 3-like [Chrysoperla carnea]
MKFVIVLVAVTIACVYARPDGAAYPTKYDSIDVAGILENPKLRGVYEKCISGEQTAKCPKEVDVLKEYLTDAITTCCEKCSQKQKDGARQVFKYYKANNPEFYNQLKSKHDPTGEFETKCKSILEG